MSKPDEYQVEGYGNRNFDYDQPYLAGAGFDPDVAFAKAGDPKEQAKHQKDVSKDLDGDFKVIPTHTPVNPTHPTTLNADEFGTLLQPNQEHTDNSDKVTKEDQKKENVPTPAAKPVTVAKKTASPGKQIKKVTSANTTRKD